MSSKISNWASHLILAAIVATSTHALTVWAVPLLIMDRIIALGSADSGLERANGVTLPPPTDHTQRRIVMPSPDLLYATCFFDLTDEPMRVTLSTDYPRYWSIALYASTSDNFFVLNDRSAPDGRVNLTVIAPHHDAANSTPQNSETRVVSPTRRGMLLMRLLVNDDPKVRAAAEAARRSLRCSP